jgi:MoaA/NifB/PqqE/SkfB family radical SAM enzyme
MCNIPGTRSSEELKPSQIKTIFSKLKALDLVRITGGEPFLRKDLGDIVNIIDDCVSPQRIVVSSNGILTDRIVEILKKVRQLQKIHIEISLDGTKEDHDRIRCRKGSYEDALRTLKQLSKLRRPNRFHLNVSQVILDGKGIADYFRLKQVLSPLDVDVYPVIAYDADTALYSGRVGITDPSKAYQHDEAFRSQLKRFIERLFRNGNTGDWGTGIAKRYYLMGIYNRIIRGEKRPNPRCVALSSHMRISPNGDIPVCMHNSNVVGNLLKENFREIWFGESIPEHRRWVYGCPGCWVGCEVIPNGVYTGDMLRAIPGI